MACKTKIPALDSNRKELSDMCKFLRVKQKEGTIFNVSFTSQVLHKRIQVLEKLDVDLDDPNSTYIEASRLKKRTLFTSSIKKIALRTPFYWMNMILDPMQFLKGGSTRKWRKIG